MNDTNLHENDVDELQTMRREEVEAHIHPAIILSAQNLHPLGVFLCLEVGEVAVVQIGENHVDGAADVRVVAEPRSI